MAGRSAGRDCLSLLPLAHGQRHRLGSLIKQLRLQLKPLVQGAVLERPVAERILDVLELVRPALDDGNRGLEQRDLGLVPTFGVAMIAESVLRK